MIVWWIVGALSLSLFLLNSVMAKPSRHGNIAWVLSLSAFLFLFFLLAIRGEGVGVDWLAYKEIYSGIPTFPTLIIEGGWLPLNIEPGYQLYMSFLKFFNFHPNFLPTFLFMISYIMIMKGCKRWRVPPLAMTAMIILLIYPHYYGQIRMAFVYTLGILIGLAVLNQSRKVVIVKALLASSVQYIGLAYFAALPFIRRNALNPSLKPSYLEWRLSTLKRINIVLAFVFISFVAYVVSEDILAAFMHLVSLMDNPVASKLFSYYLRIEEVNRSFLGISVIAIFGISMVSLSNREILQNRKVMIVSGIGMLVAVFIANFTGGFPVLAHRITSMILIPSLAILLSMVSLRSKNNFFFYFVLFCYSIYKFGQISVAIGLYSTL